jgi:hypothetical protein
MKTIMTTTIITLLICSICLSGLMPLVKANPSIMITDYTITPEILMPGDTALLTLTIKNTELTATTSTATTDGDSTTTSSRTIGGVLNDIWVVPAYDKTRQIRATRNYEDIGILAPAASITISFTLLVDKNFTEGVYFPVVHIDVDGYQDVNFPITVNVRNTSVDLLSKEIPSKLSMSGATEISLTAVNKRDSSVDGVTVTPNPVQGIDFIPENYFIGTLAAGASQDITFSVRPQETGQKTITFTNSFLNGDNTHTNNLTVAVDVIETLDVAPVFKALPGTVVKGSNARISLEVYNAKTEPITGVILIPVTDGTIFPSQYFIGAMDPDDVFSATFDLSTNTLAYGNHTVGFKVSFKQGNDYYLTPVISTSFTVVKGDGSAQATGTGTSSAGPGSLLTMCILTIVLIVVVLVVAFLVYRRWKKRRKTL